MRPSRWMLLPIIAWALAAAADDGPFTLDNVLERARPADGEFASGYRQTRASTLLTETVRSHGRIVFTAPDRLRRTERGPGDSRRTIMVDGDTVRVDDGESVSRYPLAQAPTLALLMDVLAAVAAADAERLRTAFDARLDGSWSDWRIALQSPVPEGVPGKDRAAKPAPSRVTIAGAGGRVKRLVIDSPRSGRIRIRFTGTDSG